jgi:type IV secretion system protein VirD4
MVTLLRAAPMLTALVAPRAAGPPGLPSPPQVAAVLHAMPGGPLGLVAAMVVLGAVVLGARWVLHAFLLIPPGMARAVELRREMSARAARASLARTRPSLLDAHGRLAAAEYSYRIGRCRSPWYMVRGSFEDSALILGPPGANKTV